MNYDVELIREKSYKPTFWSGGMATELITYPVDSDYASRNFLWRLGIAKLIYQNLLLAILQMFHVNL